MKFIQTPLPGAFVIELERNGDDRGFFARLFCEREFAAAGLVNRFVQINNSLSGRRGTLRGLHYQLAPSAEVKLMRCVRGAIFDVVLDLRVDSPTFAKWFGVELTADNRKMMYVPKGFAHGLLTLTDDTEVIYPVSDYYAPQHERGIRFDDPRFGIEWPLDPVEVSGKDRGWPNFNMDYHLPTEGRLSFPK